MYSPYIRKVLSLILQDYVNEKVTQLLIGESEGVLIWFSQSEVVLISNFKLTKSWRTRQRMFSRTVGGY